MRVKPGNFDRCDFTPRVSAPPPRLRSSRSLHAVTAWSRGFGNRSQRAHVNNWRLHMKTIITLLTTTVVPLGAITTASALEQGSDEAANYALSWKAARGSTQNFGGTASARGGRDFGAYASAREGRQVRNGGFNVPAMHDFQL